jgi:hypothetical protein
MKGDMVEKRKILVGSVELEGLIAMGEYVIEDDVVDIPGFEKTTPVRSGVKKIPPIPAEYKIQRGSKTLKLLEDWYYKKETHDITVIRTDGHGNEFGRELMPNCEVSNLHAPAYDASSIVVAKAMIILLPEDIIPIGSGG